MWRSLIALLACTIAPAGTATAQQTTEQQPITWVRHFTAKPGGAEKLMSLFMEWDAAIFDELVDDGKALDWGVYGPLTREPAQFTHAVWITAPTWATIDDLMVGFATRYAERAPKQNLEIARRFEEACELSTVEDQVYRHVSMLPYHAPSESDAPAKYIKFSYHRVFPGKEKQAEALYDRLALPVYGSLREKHAILDAGFATQELVTTNEWTHVSWAVLPDLASIDIVRAAFESTESGRSEEQNVDVKEQVRTMLDPEAHRSTIMMILHHKAGAPR